MPIPGSPPMSTTEPGTIPPPNTRLSSPMGTGMRSKPSAEICGKGWGSLVGVTEGRGRSSRSITVSTMVFHSPQLGQRPIHLGEE